MAINYCQGISVRRIILSLERQRQEVCECMYCMWKSNFSPQHNDHVSSTFVPVPHYLMESHQLPPSRRPCGHFAITCQTQHACSSPQYEYVCDSNVLTDEIPFLNQGDPGSKFHSVRRKGFVSGRRVSQ